MSNISELPNPFTPLAFLDPTLAAQFEASRYLHVATMGAFMCDLLVSIPQETQLLRHHHSHPTVIYFVGRITTMAYIMTESIFEIMLLKDCGSLQLASCWCFTIAVSSTSFLFFLCIKAIFASTPIVVYIFFFIWTGVLGASIVIPFGTTGTHIGSGQYCILARVGEYGGPATVTNMVHSTLIFLAITWKLLSSNHEASDSPLAAFVSGKGFSRTAAVLLQSGQLYYFTTIGLNVLTVIMVYSESEPPVFHLMFYTLNIALENAMACRVFRMLKFDTKRSYIDTIMSEEFASRPLAFGSSRRVAIGINSHTLVTSRPTQVAAIKYVEHDGTNLAHETTLS